MRYPNSLSLSVLMAALFAIASSAQEPTVAPRDVVERTSAELDELLGPIALYPDDLVALMLPAAAEPTDIVLAARFLDDDAENGEIDEQPWDDSVRALAHFEDVVVWMNQNLSWTRQVGEAFLAQPAAVMQSVQRLRARAYAAGTLRDTPQHRVLVDGAVIRIVSAEENVVYVPTYDTRVVYVDRSPSYSASYFTYGIGWSIGSWNRWECDWYGNRVWIWDTHNHWREHRHHHYVNYTYAYRPSYRYDVGGRAWRSPSVRVRRNYDNAYHSRRAVVRPNAYVENHSRARYQDRHDDRRPDRDRSDTDRRSIRNGVILPANPSADRPRHVTRSEPAGDNNSRDYLTRSRNRPPSEATPDREPTGDRNRRTYQTRSTTTPTPVSRVATPTPTPSHVAYITSAPRDVPAPSTRPNPTTARSSGESSSRSQVSAPPRTNNGAGRSQGNNESNKSRDYLQRSRTTRSDDKSNNDNGSGSDDGNSSGRSGNRGRGR